MYLQNHLLIYNKKVIINNFRILIKNSLILNNYYKI